MLKKLLIFTMVLFSVITFSAEKIKLATIGIFPMKNIAEIVKTDLEKEGYEVELVLFSDYNTPNIALSSKEVDANFIQHKPYMEFFNKNLKNLSYVTPVYNFELGFYSKKYRSIAQLPKGASIVLPNDPVNLSWGLKILKEAKLIDLKGNKITYTLEDVINPKEYKFSTVSIGNLVQAYQESDLVFNWPSHMLKIGVSPDTRLIKVVDKSNIFAVSLVARKDNINSKKVQALKNAFHSKEVKDFLLKEYKGAGYPAF